MSVSKNVFKTSIIYFIGQVLTKVIAFILLPLYTNYISTTDFGYYDLTLSVLGVVIPVIFMEIWTGVLRFAIENKDEEYKKIIINNSLIIVIVSFIIYTIVYGMAFLFMNFRLPIMIYVYSIIWIFQLIILNIARVYGKNTLYASSGVVNVLINALMTILIVKLTNGNIISLYIGVTLGIIVQSIMIERSVKVLKNFSIKSYDTQICKELIKFSLPLSFNSVVYWMMEGFNKIIISNKLGMAANGIYAVGNRLSTVLNLVLQVFLLAWQETIFKISTVEEKLDIYNTGFNLMIKVIGGGLVVLLPLISLSFKYIIGNDYSSARNLIPFLLLVIFLNSLSSILTSCFAAEKDNKSTLLSRCVSGTINVVVLFLTIDKIGLYASPLALCSANIIGIITQIILLKKHVLLKPNAINCITFIILFMISLIAYLGNNNLINTIWLIISSLFYIYYLKDFIMKIFVLSKNMLKR